MLRGVTLLELLVAMLIISIGLKLSLPLWQQHNELLILGKERQKLYLFLRKMQARAENSNQIWLLLANRDLAQNRWCFTAQMKSDSLCDCLNPQNCPQAVAANFYYPYFSGQSMLISKKYFPQEISRLSGIRDTISNDCFALQVGDSRSLFQPYNVGSIKMVNNQSESACNDD